MFVVELFAIMHIYTAIATIKCTQMKNNKYRNKKITIDGISFDSTKEAKRWQELKLLERGGVISELERQIKFPFKINGELICTYICDFSYVENGRHIIEDVKSSYTAKLPVYRIKKKLLKAIYGLEIIET